MEIKNLLKSKPAYEGQMFFVPMGDRCGQFLLFLKHEKEKDRYSVLALPECDPIYIGVKEIQGYQDGGFLEFVEKVPKDVLSTSISEFNLRESRLKQ